MDEHIVHLELVLTKLQEQQLYINAKKCMFGQKQVEYLGHIISEEGVAADPAKLEAISSWPTPRNIKGLRGFLWLTGYYRKFVRGYGIIARPLTDQLKKDAFCWNAEAQATFEQLKDSMCTVPVLALPNFSAPFIVQADASGTGLGAVLLQK